MKRNTAATRSVDELVQLIKQGVRPKYVFFWGHKARVPGRVDASCFSNWFPAPFTIAGVTYPTTEHYMMAEKARLFGDDIVLAQVLSSRSPGRAKALGRRVRNFNERIWERYRFDIVVAGDQAKFSQNRAHGAFLARTGSKVLVEASPHDRIWGIGMGRDRELAENPSMWKGLNLLGFALMEVRARLAENSDPELTSS